MDKVGNGGWKSAPGRRNDTAKHDSLKMYKEFNLARTQSARDEVGRIIRA